jgi:hypothetical protein
VNGGAQVLPIMSGEAGGARGKEEDARCPWRVRIGACRPRWHFFGHLASVEVASLGSNFQHLPGIFVSGAYSKVAALLMIYKIA